VHIFQLNLLWLTTFDYAGRETHVPLVSGNVNNAPFLSSPHTKQTLPQMIKSFLSCTLFW